MTTIESVMTANEELTAAFEELVVVRMAMVPKRHSGLSAAMEGVNEVTDVEAKTNIWEKLKAFFKKFFDFILGRNNKAKEKYDEVSGKVDDTEAKVKAWIDEINKKAGMAAAAASSSNNNTRQSPKDQAALIKQAILKNGDDIQKVIAEKINADTRSAAVLATYIDRKTWGISDLMRTRSMLDVLANTCKRGTTMIKDYTEALARGPSGYEQLAAIGSRITRGEVAMPAIELPDGGITFDGNIKNMTAGVYSFRNLIKDTENKIRDCGPAIIAIQVSLNKAIEEAKGDEKYSALLRRIMVNEISQISLSHISAKNQLSSLLGNVGSLLMAPMTGLRHSALGDEVSERIKQETGATSDLGISIEVDSYIINIVG